MDKQINLKIRRKRRFSFVIIALLTILTLLLDYFFINLYEIEGVFIFITGFLLLLDILLLYARPFRGIKLYMLLINLALLGFCCFNWFMIVVFGIFHLGFSGAGLEYYFYLIFHSIQNLALTISCVLIIISYTGKIQKRNLIK